MYHYLKLLFSQKNKIISNLYNTQEVTERTDRCNLL